MQDSFDLVSTPTTSPPLITFSGSEKEETAPTPPLDGYLLVFFIILFIMKSCIEVKFFTVLKLIVDDLGAFTNVLLLELWFCPLTNQLKRKHMNPKRRKMTELTQGKLNHSNDLVTIKTFSLLLLI